jgi:hypothetical protein
MSSETRLFINDCGPFPALTVNRPQQTVVCCLKLVNLSNLVRRTRPPFKLSALSPHQPPCNTCLPLGGPGIAGLMVQFR